MTTTQTDLDAREREYNAAMRLAELQEDERLAQIELQQNIALSGPDGPRPPINLARPAQMSFIDDLLRDIVKVGKGEIAVTATEWIGKQRAAGKFDFDLASRCIVKLKGHLVGTPFERDKPRPAAARIDRGDGIPDGYYAVGTKAHARFYRIKTDKQGRRWVDIYNGRGRVRPSEVYAAIRAQGIEVCALLFGELLDRCSDCGLELTDDDSRAYARGPKCRKKRRDAGLPNVRRDDPEALLRIDQEASVDA